MDRYNYTLNVDEAPEFQLDVAGDDNLNLDPHESISVTVNAVIDLNTGKPIRFWTGTLQEYNALPVIYGDVDYRIIERSCYVGES